MLSHNMFGFDVVWIHPCNFWTIIQDLLWTVNPVSYGPFNKVQWSKSCAKQRCTSLLPWFSIIELTLGVLACQPSRIPVGGKDSHRCLSCWNSENFHTLTPISTQIVRFLITRALLACWYTWWQSLIMFAALFSVVCLSWMLVLEVKDMA